MDLGQFRAKGTPALAAKGGFMEMAARWLTESDKTIAGQTEVTGQSLPNQVD